MLVGVVLTGDLRFEDVSLRYFPGGPLALRHVNFHVQSCEKVRHCTAVQQAQVAIHGAHSGLHLLVAPGDWGHMPA